MDPRPATIPPDLVALGSADAAFESVLDLAELPDGAMRRISRGELDILLANTPAGIVATEDRCPACDAPLEADRISRQKEVDRASCRRCGLQLVRRQGEGWAEIRG